MLIPSDAADFLIALAFGKKLHDLPLARGKPLGLVLARTRIAGEIAGEDHLGDAVGEVVLVLAERADRRNQVPADVAFQNVAARPHGEDFVDHLLALLAGEDEDLGCRLRTLDLPGGFQSVEFRHGQIQHGDIRL